MSDSALDDLRFLEKRFRGVLDLVPKLEKITSLENYLLELEKRRASLVEKVEAEEDSLDALVLSKDTVNKEIAQTLADAKDAAKVLIASAKSEAHDVIFSANEEASKIVQAAKDAAQAADQKLLEKKAQIGALDVDIAKKQDAADYLKSELARLKSKL